MKKWLIYGVIVCLLLSALPMAVSAQENGEIALPPIRLEGTAFSSGALVATPAQLMLSSWTGELGVGSMQFYWMSHMASDRAACPVYDLSDMDYIELEVFISDVALLRGVPFVFELTSSGICDIEEDSFVAAWDTLAEMQDGWNTVRIPLSTYPRVGADRTRINALRIFCNGSVTVPAGQELQMHYRKVSFGTEEAGDMILLPFDARIGVGGMHPYGGGQARSWTIPNGTDVLGGRGFVTSWVGAPMDLREYEYVDICFWVRNPESFRYLNFELELTSSGRCDVEESAYCGYFPDIVQGRNTVRVPLSVISRPTQGEANMAAVNFVRMYTLGGVTQGDTVFELESMTFGSYAEPNWVEYVITPGQTDGLPEAVELVCSAYANEDLIFADKDQEIVYSLTLDQSENMELSDLLIIGQFGGRDALVQVGTRNEEGYYVDVWNEQNPVTLERFSMINVGSLLPLEQLRESGNQIFLRIADYNPSDGNGGNVVIAGNLTFCVGYSESEASVEEEPAELADMLIDFQNMLEMLSDAHTVPIFGCNVPIGSFILDDTNYKAGASSLTYTLGSYTDGNGAQQTNNGQSNFSFGFADVLPQASIDATSMDTLEFWFYVSDKDALAAVSFADNALELTSSGTCDSQEICWRMNDILAQCEQNGWNPIRLSLENPSGATGNINFSALNYLRWYFISASNLPAQPITIKIDNIRLTDYREQNKEKTRPIAEAMIQRVNEALSGIPNWDDEDAAVIAQYKEHAKEWQALCEQLRGEYDAMDSFAREMAFEQGGEVRLNRLERYLSLYETYLAEGKDTPAPVEPPKEDEPVEPPEDEPIDENPKDEGSKDAPPTGEEPKEEEPQVDPPADETPAVERDMTMIYLIIIAVLISIVLDIVVYVALRRKDRRMVKND